MILISQVDFAKMIGISRQAVSKAVKKKMIPHSLDGKIKKIDIENEIVKAYMKTTSLKRSNIIRKITQPDKKGKKSNEIKIVKPGKQKKQVKAIIVPEKKKLIPITDADGPDNDELETQEDDYQYSIEYLKARAEKEKQTVIEKKLKNAKMRGDLLDREAVYTSVIMYLDKVNSNLERLSDSFLSDIGSDIVTASKVTPEIRERWRSSVLEQIDDAKKLVIKKIKEIEKGQAG